MVAVYVYGLFLVGKRTGKVIIHFKKFARPGRPPKVTKKILCKIVRAAKNKRGKSGSVLSRNQRIRNGIKVFHSTLKIHRVLRKACLKPYRKIRRVGMTEIEIHKQQRRKWIIQQQMSIGTM